MDRYADLRAVGSVALAPCAFLYSVERVHQQVHQHLLDLAGVRAHRRDWTAAVYLQRYAPVEHLPCQRDRLICDVPEVHGDTRRGLAPGELQQLAYQLSRSTRGGLRAVEPLPLFGLHARKLNAAADASEQVVEVVRHPGDQRPQRLALLRDEQLLLETNLVRHVARDNKHFVM